ncbi:DUF2550 domain-containing protein [Brachybacterium sp. JHP9]|uniref:DUF2550 domain-containing protein n=1 Tax=Brachybacterium equifaecis TaxID=2910770 RepID=A0ABT0R1X5_9MICO|nr:DUF2550 family protein [Brachybacterium equifaecis]MCL6423770.1 DUF2550 domain-containing protein [Brachybacterium equifaecis]
MDVPIILVVIGAFVVAGALAVVLRQILVARPRGSFECSVQRPSRMHGITWQSGLMRFGSDRLRWFRAFSLRLKPEEVLRREDITDLQRQPLPSALPGMDDYVLLAFERGSRPQLRTVLSPQAASAIVAWYEAAPTGGFVGDAD